MTGMDKISSSLPPMFEFYFLRMGSCNGRMRRKCRCARLKAVFFPLYIPDFSVRWLAITLPQQVATYFQNFSLKPFGHPVCRKSDIPKWYIAVICCSMGHKSDSCNWFAIFAVGVSHVVSFIPHQKVATKSIVFSIALLVTCFRISCCNLSSRK